jgi:hypothetical protein
MSDEEQAAVMNEIEKRGLDGMFDALIEAARPFEDYMKRSAVVSWLGENLRTTKPDAKFYKRLRDYVNDDRQPEKAIRMTISALSSAETKEAVEILSDLAANHKNPKVRRRAFDSIEAMNRRPGDETFSPELNRLWSATKVPEDLLDIGSAMAERGAPSSIELLLATALAPFGGENGNQFTAMRALERVHTPNALPPIVALVEKSKPGSMESDLGYRLLAQIYGNVGEATFLKSLTKAGMSVKDTAENWLGGALELRRVKKLQAFLDSGVKFQSPELRAALAKAVKDAFARDKELRKLDK